MELLCTKLKSNKFKLMELRVDGLDHVETTPSVRILKQSKVKSTDGNKQAF